MDSQSIIWRKGLFGLEDTTYIQGKRAATAFTTHVSNNKNNNTPTLILSRKRHHPYWNGLDQLDDEIEDMYWRNERTLVWTHHEWWITSVNDARVTVGVNRLWCLISVLEQTNFNKLRLDWLSCSVRSCIDLSKLLLIVPSTYYFFSSFHFFSFGRYRTMNDNWGFSN